MQPKPGGDHFFADRKEAGRQLGVALKALDLPDPVVLALPRGGVPVGFEVARALAAPLDVVLVRKIGAPGQPEYAIGAVVDASGPLVVLNDEGMHAARPSPAYVEAETVRQIAEMERRRLAYAANRPAIDIRGRTIILVDDGIATGSTVRAALKALRKAGAGRIVLAVPVAPEDTLQSLRQEADEIVCLLAPSPFLAVGLHYSHFAQTTDEEVIRLLGEAAI